MCSSPVATTRRGSSERKVNARYRFDSVRGICRCERNCITSVYEVIPPRGEGKHRLKNTTSSIDSCLLVEHIVDSGRRRDGMLVSHFPRNLSLSLSFCLEIRERRRDGEDEVDEEERRNSNAQVKKIITTAASGRRGLGAAEGRRARPPYVERLTRIARGGTHGRNLF